MRYVSKHLAFGTHLTSGESQGLTRFKADIGGNAPGIQCHVTMMCLPTERLPA